jgi:hypothetical protein
MHMRYASATTGLSADSSARRSRVGSKARLCTAVLDREARFTAGEGDTTLGDHPFSLITCVRVSCASNAGKLEVGSHSWRSLLAPACPGNGFSLREPGYWYTVFISTSPGGLRGSAHSISDITDKLGSDMPAANEAGPNLQRTIPFVR